MWWNSFKGSNSALEWSCLQWASWHSFNRRSRSHTASWGQSCARQLLTEAVSIPGNQDSWFSAVLVFGTERSNLGFLRQSIWVTHSPPPITTLWWLMSSLFWKQRLSSYLAGTLESLIQRHCCFGVVCLQLWKWVLFPLAAEVAQFFLCHWSACVEVGWGGMGVGVGISWLVVTSSPFPPCWDWSSRSQFGVFKPKFSSNQSVNEASHSHPGSEVFLLERKMKSLSWTCGLPSVVSVFMPHSWTEWKKRRGCRFQCKVVFYDVILWRHCAGAAYKMF